MTAEELGERIRGRRVHLGMSRREVADQIGISEKGYGHYETGRSEPTPTTLSRLGEIFTVPVAYFYGDDEFEGPSTNRYYDGLPPAARNTADEVIKALWLESQRAATTHGKKAE